MASDMISPTPVHVVDRAIFVSRSVLVEIVAFQLKRGAIVQVEDSTQPRAMRLCYEVRPGEAFHLVDAIGRQIGIFADAAALVAHAEAVTR